MKKDVEAAQKPLPEVAKEPIPEPVPEPTKEETPKVEKATDRPSTAPVPPASQPEPAGSVFWPLLFGGVIAAALGYFAAELNVFNTRPVVDTLQQTVERQESRIADLEAAEPAAPADNTETQEVLASLSSQIEDLTAQMAALDSRLVVVEKQPVTGGDGASAAAIAAYERELAALQETVADMIDDARNVEAATADAAREARVREALAGITTAIGTGQPFGDALGALENAGVADIPQVLSDNAATGVATIANLQGSFPDTARVALSTARSAGEMAEETGVGGFLRRQLGARSVAPRDGDGPDAVLSRAEAAMRDGQLAAALTELDGLSDGTKSAIENWLNDARAHLDATEAVKSISQSLTAN